MYVVDIYIYISVGRRCFHRAHRVHHSPDSESSFSCSPQALSLLTHKRSTSNSSCRAAAIARGEWVRACRPRHWGCHTPPPSSLPSHCPRRRPDPGPDSVVTAERVAMYSYNACMYVICLDRNASALSPSPFALTVGSQRCCVRLSLCAVAISIQRRELRPIVSRRRVTKERVVRMGMEYRAVGHL